MPDVNRPGYSVDAIYLRQHPEMRGERPDPGNHTVGRRVGVLGMSMQCQTCGTICMPHHETFVLTDNETGESWTIPGAWVGPPDDPYRHLFPFGQRIATSADETDEHSATEDEPPTPRPAGVSAASAAKGRSRDTPSRSPEARHAEYVRAKRREAQREREG